MFLLRQIEKQVVPNKEAIKKIVQGQYCVLRFPVNLPFGIVRASLHQLSRHIQVHFVTCGRLRTLHVRQNGSFGITTFYATDRPRIESRWGRYFPHASRAAQRPSQPPVKGVRVSFPGVKQTGRGVNQPPQLAPSLRRE